MINSIRLKLLKKPKYDFYIFSSEIDWLIKAGATLEGISETTKIPVITLEQYRNGELVPYEDVKKIANVYSIGVRKLCSFAKKDAKATFNPNTH